MNFTGAAPSENIKHLMCKARADVGAMTGDTYLKVLLPNGWIRSRELVVCGMIQADRLPGLVPLPSGRMIRWSSRMSIEVAAPTHAPGNPLSGTGGEEQPPTGMDWSWCV